MRTSRSWTLLLLGMIAVSSFAQAAEAQQAKTVDNAKEERETREALARFYATPALAAVREPERVEVLLVEETGAGISATHRVIEGPGKAVTLQGAAMRDAGKAVLSLDSYFGAASACLFQPAFALRFHRKGESVQVLVCLLCNELQFQDRGGRRIGERILFDGSRSRLPAIARKAFPREFRIFAGLRGYNPPMRLRLAHWTRRPRWPPLPPSPCVPRNTRNPHRATRPTSSRSWTKRRPAAGFAPAFLRLSESPRISRSLRRELLEAAFMRAYGRRRRIGDRRPWSFRRTRARGRSSSRMTPASPASRCSSRHAAARGSGPRTRATCSSGSKCILRRHVRRPAGRRHRRVLLGAERPRANHLRRQPLGGHALPRTVSLARAPAERDAGGRAGAAALPSARRRSDVSRKPLPCDSRGGRDRRARLLVRRPRDRHARGRPAARGPGPGRPGWRASACART